MSIVNIGQDTTLGELLQERVDFMRSLKYGWGESGTEKAIEEPTITLALDIISRVSEVHGQDKYIFGLFAMDHGGVMLECASKHQVLGTEIEVDGNLASVNVYAEDTDSEYLETYDVEETVQFLLDGLKNFQD